MVFLRGIGCNWLVCLVCYFGIQGRDLTYKIIGIWWPIFAFVSLGYDHVVVNMMFVPMAIWANAPAITVGLYIWKGIMPTQYHWRRSVLWQVISAEHCILLNPV